MADSRDYKEATEALKEYEETLERVREKELERQADKIKMYEASKNSLDNDKRALENLIEEERLLLEAQRARTGGTEKQIEQRQKEIELSEAKIKLLQEIRDLESDDKDKFKKDLEEKSDILDDLKGKLGEFAREIKEKFGEIDEAIIASMGDAALLSVLFDIDLPSVKEMFSEFGKSLDSARRGLIPYVASVQDATLLQRRMADTARETGIPMADLHAGAGQAASSFRMFGTQVESAQAKIVSFAAQMKLMGAGEGAGSSILESLITDSGLQSLDSAEGMFKTLTMQMKELGVMPKTLSDNYTKLIGTFAMFGAEAPMSIAKVSYQAEKAQVDVGSITGFTENFKGYSQAAQTAQSINAIFGRRIIDNPAELVRVFYTGGPPAAMELVKRKLIDSGIDLEEMLSGAAGAARLQMLAGMGLGSARDARRSLLAATMTEEEQLKIESGAADGGTAAGISNFDNMQKAILTQQQKNQAMQEQITIDFMKKIGIQLGDLGNLYDGAIARVERSLREGMDMVLGKEGENVRDINIPGIGKVGDLIDKLIKEGGGILNTPPREEAEITKANYEQDRKLVENTGNLNTTMAELIVAVNNLNSSIGSVSSTDTAGRAREQMLNSVGLNEPTMRKFILNTVEDRANGKIQYNV